MLNFTEPETTENASSLVGSMVPDSRKTYVVILRVATSLTKGVLKLTTFADTPDTSVMKGSPNVKSVRANVCKLGGSNKQQS
jgi:hypothetical protein